MAINTLTFLVQQPFGVYQTRGRTFTADGNGFLANPTVPFSSTEVLDLVASGAVPSFASPYSSFRNILDGGDFTVNPWQRAGTALGSAGALVTPFTNTPIYFPDRWFGACGASGSGNMVQTADTTVAGFSTSCFLQRTSA